jgi:hypothetical protein
MERVIAPSPADYNHVIIDACDSYFMVAARGGGAYPEDHIPLSQADELVRSFLAGDGILQEPRTGFLVSTNQAAESHEYDGFRAGVFSHVVRSALVGAADADGDGRLEYSEVLAYVAASQRIEDPGARLNVFGRAPPRNVHRPVLDLGRSAFKHWLRLGPELSGRIHVNDARNIRYADLHKPAGTSALVALVEQPSYRVVTSSGEAQVRLRGMGSGALRAHPVEVPGRRARGPEESLRGELFSIPYDGSFYRGFVVSRGMAPARTEQPFLPPDAVRPWRVPARPPFLLGAPGVVALAGGGLLGAGAVLTTLAHLVSYDTLLRTLQTEGVVDEQVTQQLVVLKTATVLFLAAGLSLVALGGVLVALEVLLPRGGGEP